LATTEYASVDTETTCMPIPLAAYLANPVAIAVHTGEIVHDLIAAFHKLHRETPLHIVPTRKPYAVRKPRAVRSKAKEACQW
jgi:hypothetical protein